MRVVAQAKKVVLNKLKTFFKLQYFSYLSIYSRLDGLDPMIAWAMGSATGHVAMALWKDDELFMCESNALSPYWYACVCT